MKNKLIAFLFITILLSSCSSQADKTAFDLYTEGYAIINNKINHEDFIAQIYDTNSNEIVEEIPIETSGTFEIPSLPDGTYNIQAVSVNSIPCKSSSVSFSIEKDKVRAEDNIKLIITNIIKEELIITGIVDFPNEMNHIDIKILLAKEENRKPIRTFTVDPIGTFEIKGLENGVYFIAAKYNDIYSEWLEIKIENEELQNNEEIIIKLEKIK